MKNARTTILIAISIAIISLFFAGCGAGEGSNDNSSIIEPTASPTTFELKVHVKQNETAVAGAIVTCKDITSAVGETGLSEKAEEPDPQAMTDENGNCVFDGLFADHTYYLFAQGVGSQKVIISSQYVNCCTIGESATIIVKTVTADSYEGITNVLVDFGGGLQEVSDPYGYSYFPGLPAGTYVVEATPQFGDYVPQTTSVTAGNGEVTEIVIVIPSATPSP